MKNSMPIVPLLTFFENLEPKMWTKIARNIDLLALHNITLREPLVKPVENGIFELRTQVGNIKNSKTGSVKWIV